jgi:hypothetical protein
MKLHFFSLWYNIFATLTLHHLSSGVVYWLFPRIWSDIEQENGLAEEKERLSDTPVHSGHNPYIFVHQPAHIPRLQLPLQDRLPGRSRMPHIFPHQHMPSIGRSQEFPAESPRFAFPVDQAWPESLWPLFLHQRCIKFEFKTV